MTIKLDWLSDQELHIHYIDSVSGDELVQSALGVSGDRRFDSLRKVMAIWIRGNVNDTQLGVKDIETFAACNKAMAKTNPKVRVASVLLPNDVHRGTLARLLEAIGSDDPWDRELFYVIEEAQSWLDQGSSQE